MRQNMFQEGLYQVFVRDSTPPQPAAANQGDLGDARIHRWFGAVVNGRLLVAGVVQVLGALACMLATVTYICVSYGCAVSMATPVWSSLCHVAAGAQAVAVQKKPNKFKVLILMSLNLLSLLFGFSALLANSLNPAHPIMLNTTQQRIGSHVAKGSYITFTAQCSLVSVYVLFLSYRGLKRYSSPHVLTYSRVSQNPDDGVEPLLEEGDFSL